MTNLSDVNSAYKKVFVINGGSSSIKFAFYKIGKLPEKKIHGSVERIGLLDTNLTFSDSTGKQKVKLVLKSADIRSAVNFLIDWLGKKIDFSSVGGIGHRVVFGLNHIEPECITQELLNELSIISPYDSDHLPVEVELMEALMKRYPKIPQASCYDRAFHNTIPRVAIILPVPRRFETMGIKRYGFHGLSYSYLIEKIARAAGTKAANGRVILARLSNGASLAAVNEGKSIDTTMSFSPEVLVKRCGHSFSHL